jgi:hypothetical protein
MYDQLPKAARRALRDGCEQAYKRAMRQSLLPLAEDFDRWKLGAIDSFELGERIHRWHQGPNRELYLRFGDVSNQELVLTVARAVHDGLLDVEDVPEAAQETVGKVLSVLREMNR